jgi:NAD(P)-dependent dehydrogenase (short-subunit alcohol dehydrogenase family)
MADSESLKGKTALVTGASRGIGAEIATEFARRGANLIICARSADGLTNTAERCRTHDVKVLSEKVDLEDRDAIPHLFESINQSGSGLDIVVNNAAVLIKNEMALFPLDDFERMLRVNITASLHVSQLALPFLKQGRGTIVNISSLSGCFGVPKFRSFGAYNISKYGVWGLTEILALEFADFGVRVNQISFAGVDTAMFRYGVGESVEAPIRIEDAARHVVYLASPESAPLTGENIILAGAPLSR